MNCEECGACCRFIKLFIGEIPRDTRKWLRLHGVGYQKGFIFIYSSCEWLKGNSCIHYERRPIICRKFKKGSDNCHEAVRIEVSPLSPEPLTPQQYQEILKNTEKHRKFHA